MLSILQSNTAHLYINLHAVMTNVIITSFMNPTLPCSCTSHNRHLLKSASSTQGLSKVNPIYSRVEQHSSTFTDPAWHHVGSWLHNFAEDTDSA